MIIYMLRCGWDHITQHFSTPMVTQKGHSLGLYRNPEGRRTSLFVKVIAAVTMTNNVQHSPG